MGGKSCKCSTQIFPACFAWGFFLILTAVFFLFPCRYIIDVFGEKGIAITIYDAVLSLIVFAHFVAATIIDPGKYPKAHEHETDDTRTTLHRNMDINGVNFRLKWCTTCQFYRPPRCSHCSVCDMCIDTFDHHCPWVNNCIGRRNYRFFVLFLLSLWIHMISVLAITIVAITEWRNRNDGSVGHAIPVASIVECCLVILFLIPVTGLSSFHIFLISTGRTTNEQVTGKVKANFNPFSRGCLCNWIYLFWGPRPPSMLGVREPKKLMSKVMLSKPAGASIEDVTILIDNNPEKTSQHYNSSQHSKNDWILADDTKSMASSVISDFRITQRLINPDRYNKNLSTNNLIRDEVTASLSEYYIANDGTSESSSRNESHGDTARLLSKEKVVNGNTQNGDGGSRETSADNEEEEDSGNESSALLVSSSVEPATKVTSI